MGLIIADRIILFFLSLLIFFLPISKAVIEVSAGICIFTWFIKQLLILKKEKEYSLLSRSKNIFKVSILNKALILVILANLLSVIFSSNIKLSVDAFFSKLIEYVLIFVIVRNVINSRLRYRTIIGVMLASLLFIGLDGVFQSISGYDLFRHRQLFQSRVTASFINPNDLGSYLITVMPVVLILIFVNLSKKVKIIIILTLVVAFLTLILSFSKGAWLAFLFSFIFFIFFTKKRYIFFILVGVFITSLVVPVAFNFSFFDWGERLMSFSYAGAIDRKFLWQAALRMFLHSPIFGVGLGTFMENYQIFWLKPTSEISYTHNCYLQILAETGIIGLGTFILFLFVWFKKTLKLLSSLADKSFYYFSFLGLTTGIIAYLLNSFVDTNLYALPIAVLFWFSLGLHQSAIKLFNER